MINSTCGMRASLENLQVDAKFSIVKMMQRHSGVIGQRTLSASTQVQPHEQAIAVDREKIKDHCY